MLRSNLLFVHVISAMGTFWALGIEGIALGQLRRAADGAAIKAALGSFGAAQRVAGPSRVLLFVTGLYLARAYWQWRGAWMSVLVNGTPGFVGRTRDGRVLSVFGLTI